MLSLSPDDEGTLDEIAPQLQAFLGDQSAKVLQIEYWNLHPLGDEPTCTIQVD